MWHHFFLGTDLFQFLKLPKFSAAKISPAFWQIWLHKCALDLPFTRSSAMVSLTELFIVINMGDRGKNGLFFVLAKQENLSVSMLYRKIISYKERSMKCSSEPRFRNMKIFLILIETTSKWCNVDTRHARLYLEKYGRIAYIQCSEQLFCGEHCFLYGITWESFIYNNMSWWSILEKGFSPRFRCSFFLVARYFLVCDKLITRKVEWTRPEFEQVSW